MKIHELFINSISLIFCPECQKKSTKSKFETPCGRRHNRFCLDQTSYICFAANNNVKVWQDLGRMQGPGAKVFAQLDA